MKRLSLLLFSLLFIATFSLAQDKLAQDKGSITTEDNSKDLKQAQTEFNNSTIVTTPAENSPTAILSESFEDPTFPPPGWSLLNPDGGTGWIRVTAGTTPFPGWTGSGVVTAPPGGGNAVAYCTWNTGGAVSNDQWLVSSQITNVNAGDSLCFWVWAPINTFLDSLDILISTTGTNVGDFTIVVDNLVWPTGNTDTSWTKYTYNLTDFVSAGSDIYVAWREHVADNLNDGGLIALDLVSVGPPCPIAQATNPDPADAATDVDVNLASITWTNGAGANNVEVWFDGAMVYDGTAISTWPVPGPLAYSTTYAWNVVGKNDSCSVAGPTWSFTTIACPVGAPTAPSPPDGLTDVPLTGNTAMWTNGANTTMNRVYFGTPGSLTLLYDGGAITSLSLAGVEPLAYSTTYAWQVVCVSPDCETSGPEWTFTTIADPNIVSAFMDDFNDSTATAGWWSAVTWGDLCDWGWYTAASWPSTTVVFPATASGGFIGASSDACGSVMNVYLNGTFSVDASLYQTVWIEFDSDMDVFLDPVPPDTGAVDVSIDGGASWTRVFLRQVDNRGEHAVVDISGLAGLQGDIQFRLCYYGDFSWHWALDNFGVYLDGFIPVELTSFAASVNDGNVTLTWSTATETNNQGFEVQRSSNGVEYSRIAFVEGHGTVTEAQNYTYSDKNLEVGTYTYRLKQTDFDGTSEFSEAVEVEVIAPDVYALEQNYPNPFNPSTKIMFSLAADSRVSLTVFDVLGQEVVTLINGNLSAGSHDISFNAANLNSGVYFYRINATGVNGTNFTSVKKMILTK